MKKFRVSTRVTRFSSVHGKWYAGFCYGAKSENFLSLGFVNCLLSGIREVLLDEFCYFS